MKHLFKTALFAMAAMSMATACTGNKEKSVADNADVPVVANVDIKGEWIMENIVLGDSVIVRPSEEVPGSRQTIEFNDSAFFIKTNCNTLSGPYTVNGDSIILGDGLMTEIVCDNMATEDAIRRILPGIATVSVENDSVIRLATSNPSEYISLRKTR